MVVQHNLTAMNSNRMLGITSGAQAKSSEKLSSGYKINRAADDAAGLAISEKMRKQVRGLTQASNNAEDGISAVQTAEGALTEVHDMLQRMNELAVKAANGTMSSSDRQNVQDEIDQLTTEIDRVSTTTKFNETYLLKGDDTEGASASKSTFLSFKDAGLGEYLSSTTDKEDGSYDFAVDTSKLTEGTQITVGGKAYNIVSDEEASVENGYTNGVNGNNVNAAAAENLIKNAVLQANDVGNTDGDGNTWYDQGEVDSNTTLADNVKLAKVTTKSDLSLSLHVGADSDADNKIAFNIQVMDSKGLGVKGISVTGGTPARATYAIDNIADAIATVSRQRSGLGAIQNRLEHTIKNLDNVVENTTAAESQIRDTDMASEMVKYSNNNILMQAGQSMLAQANQTNQGVLSLLR